MGCRASTAIATVDALPYAPDMSPMIAARSDSGGSSRSIFHGTYYLEVKLGQGAFSRVYSCKKAGSQFQEEFAVKIMDLRVKSAKRKGSAELQKIAEREAVVLKGIANQNHVSRVFDWLSDGHFFYIVMEKGRLSLFQMLVHMPELTEHSLGKVAKQMFLGVAGIHAVGLVHFDIKPDNFLCFGEESTVKLCDFGLAKKISGGCTVIGTRGTVAFMSPEIIAGVDVGSPTDVWSLGVSLYALLVGQFPYIPSRPDKELMKSAISSGSPEPSYHPAVANVSLSPLAQSLLKALLSRDSAIRPTVTEALEHRWFSLGAQWTPQSLKEVLRSAKNVGACSYGGRVRMDSVDVTLSNQQEEAFAVREACRKAAQTASSGTIIAMDI